MRLLAESFTMFTYAGIWRPIYWHSKSARATMYMLYTFFSIGLVYTLTISELMGALLLTNSLEDFTDISFLLISTINVCCKTTNVIFRRNRIIDLANMLINDYCLPGNNNEIKVLEKYARITRYTAWSCLVLAGMTVAVMSLGPLIQSKENRTLPFKSWLPFEFTSTSIFWLSYVHQTVAIVLCATINVANDTLICGFMLYACSQLELLSQRLIGLPQKVKLETISKKTGRLIKMSESQIISQHIGHHIHVFKYSVIVLIFLAEACCGVIGLRPIIFEKEEFTLPLPAWYPFNIKSGIQYWLTFLQQETALVIGSALSVAIDTIVTGFMGNICAQLQLLSARLQELSWTTSRAKKQDTSKDTIRVLEKHIVVQSVKHHQLIFRSADDINAIFAPVIPVQYCLSSAMFCMTVYQLTSNKTSVIQIVYLTLYLSAVLNEFLLFCWFGNEVTLTSLEFVSTIGGLDWTTMHIKTVKELLIIMLRSSSPITITGGPLITLSLQSFKAILKMSYSAFNILQQSN